SRRDNRVPHALMRTAIANRAVFAARWQKITVRNQLHERGKAFPGFLAKQYFWCQRIALRALCNRVMTEELLAVFTFGTSKASAKGETHKKHKKVLEEVHSRENEDEFGLSVSRCNQHCPRLAGLVQGVGTKTSGGQHEPRHEAKSKNRRDRCRVLGVNPNCASVLD